MEIIAYKIPIEDSEKSYFRVLQIGPSKVITTIFDGNADYLVKPVEPVSKSRFARMVTCRVVSPEGPDTK